LPHYSSALEKSKTNFTKQGGMMMVKRILILIAVILLLTGSFVGCIDNSNNTNPKNEYRVVTDDMGDHVKVPLKINKIISLAASITEILFNLDLGDKIVGRDSGSNYPKGKVENIEIVSTFEGIDLEKILAAEPDLVLLDKTLDMSDKNYNKLIENDLTVFRVYPQKLDDVINDIKLLGEVTGRESKANTIASELQERINTVKTRGKSISDPNPPKVLYVIYYDGTSSPWVGTTATISGDLITIAGGDVAVVDSSGFSIQITIEQLIDLNPDIIFTSQDETWPTPSKDSILKDQALANVNAIKTGHVIDVNADLVDRPGPRLVDGLEIFSENITSLLQR
jgi:iron complex transport system substrate-binding protein